MAVIRRNPVLSSLLACGLLAVVLGLVLWPRPVARADVGTYPPLAPADAARVAALRNAAGLDDDVLECLSASDQQLQALVPGIRSWYDAHNGDWIAADQAVTKQQARIRRLQSAINNGQDQSAALAAAQQQLAQLQAARETVLQTFRTACLGTLSPDQVTLITGMRARTAIPMPYRVLNVTPDQQQTLSALCSNYNEQLALARDPATVAALAANFNQQLATALGPANMQTLASLAQSRGPASVRVVALLNQVFPVQ